MARGVVSCPSCHALLYADRLRDLAAEAERRDEDGDLSGALGAWREALDLLPPGSRQHGAISGRVEKLSERLSLEGAVPPRPEAGAGPAGHTPGARPQRKGWSRDLAGAGTLALLLWKFKFLGVFLLTKGKLLLLGLTKGSTFLTMMLSLGVYWAAWGWKFALGIVLSIYVHEMGHVAMLRRYGIKSSAPTFIPGLGAVVRMKQYPQSVIENARVGLAGPWWGMGAAAVAYGVHLITGWASWAAIASVGAWINLFNLIPVWQLDGSRGFEALTRKHRWVASAAVGTAWLLTGEGMLFLVLIAAVVRAATRKAPEDEDGRTLAEYILLVAGLAALTLVPVTTP